MPAPKPLAAASRDPHLTLRRVERQHDLIVMLGRSTGPLTLQQLADRLGVATRTVARDLRRLQESGVPVHVVPGRGGGARLTVTPGPARVTLDVEEVAALLASLAALGPTVSDPAESAMRKLVAALSSSSELSHLRDPTPPCSAGT